MDCPVSGMRLGSPHLGIGGFLLVLVLSFVFHRNLFTLFSGDAASEPAVTTSIPASSASQNTEVQFVRSHLFLGNPPGIGITVAREPGPLSRKRVLRRPETM